MKTKLTSPIEVESNVTTGVIHSSIDASPKALKVLSSGIYSDKFKSIWREILSNAHDAQVSVVKDNVPIKVHVPTRLSPTFKVSDCGPGMSYKEIENVYGVWFKSTKEDTNDAIGFLGLGSKSPFSYVDSFIISSRQNGVMDVYSVTLGPITHLASHPTTEPDGFDVEFSVNPSDVDKFRTALVEVGKGFDVKPEVVNTEWVWSDYVFSKRYANFSIVERRGAGCDLLVRMGPVIYPVRDISRKLLEEAEEKFSHGIDKTTLNKAFSCLYPKWALLLEVDIGSVEVTASRESLSFDKDGVTLNTLIKGISEALLSHSKECASHLKGLTPFDAFVALASMDKSECEIHNLLSSNGSTDVDSTSWIDGLDCQLTTYTIGGARVIPDFRVKNERNLYFKFQNVPDRRERYLSLFNHWVRDRGFCKEKTEWVVMHHKPDEKSIAPKRRQYILDNGIPERIIMVEERGNYRKFLRNLSGKCTIVDMSTLKTTQTAKRKAAGTSCVVAYKPTASYYNSDKTIKDGGYSEHYSRRETVNLASGGIWVRVCSGRTEDRSGGRIPVIAASECFDVGNYVYVNKRDWSKFEKASNWVEWEDVISEWLKNDSKSEIERLYVKDLIYTSRDTKVVGRLYSELPKTKTLCPLFRRLFNRLDTVKNRPDPSPLTSGISRIAHKYFDKELEEVSATEKHIKEIYSKYPLLPELKPSVGLADVVEYIKITNAITNKTEN